MAEEEYIDSYSPVRPITGRVFDRLNALAPQIRAAAKAANISPFAVAAPVAREMNKQEVGDYGTGFMKGFKAYLGWSNALYHKLALARYTHRDYVADMKATEGDEPSQIDYWHRELHRLVGVVDHPVLNDLGIANIKPRGAIVALNYYLEHPEAFRGHDPLDLEKYKGHYDLLVGDLADQKATESLSVRISAAYAAEINHELSQHVRNWGQLTPDQRIEYITAYSASGGKQFRKAWNAASGHQIDLHPEKIGDTDGANYILGPRIGGGPNNLERIVNAITRLPPDAIPHVSYPPPAQRFDEVTPSPSELREFSGFGAAYDARAALQQDAAGAAFWKNVDASYAGIGALRDANIPVGAFAPSPAAIAAGVAAGQELDGPEKPVATVHPASPRPVLPSLPLSLPQNDKPYVLPRAMNPQGPQQHVPRAHVPSRGARHAPPPRATRPQGGADLSDFGFTRVPPYVPSFAKVASAAQGSLGFQMPGVATDWGAGVGRRPTAFGFGVSQAIDQATPAMPAPMTLPLAPQFPGAVSSPAAKAIAAAPPRNVSARDGTRTPITHHNVINLHLDGKAIAREVVPIVTSILGNDVVRLGAAVLDGYFNDQSTHRSPGGARG